MNVKLSVARTPGKLLPQLLFALAAVMGLALGAALRAPAAVAQSAPQAGPAASHDVTAPDAPALTTDVAAAGMAPQAGPGIPGPNPPAQPAILQPESAASEAFLPILGYLGNDEVCDTWVTAQNVGAGFTAVSLVLFGAPGFCTPQAAGPLKIECSGILKPGSSWNFLGAQIPAGAKSAQAFGLSTKMFSDLGLLGLVGGEDDIIAAYFCENLFFNIVGDADDYRRFKLAYDTGGVFGGIPMDLVVGQPIAVEVYRRCVGPDSPGTITSKYGAIGGRRLGVYDPVYGGYTTYVPLLYAGASGYESWMYMQNNGYECSTVEIWFQQQDTCLRATICEVFTLSPGETYQWAASDCVGPGWVGSAWIRTSQPMAIAIDHIAPSLLMTYVAGYGYLRYTFDGEYTFNPASQMAYGPLVFSEYNGWDTGIVVQNLSHVVNAKVKVYFLDRSGDIVTTLVDWVCPRGSQSFFLPAIADLPGSWVGSVRVESQKWATPGGPVVEAPPVQGVVQLVQYPDIQRLSTNEGIAYNMLQEYDAYDWQLGNHRGGSASGTTVLAMPHLVKDLSNTGVTDEVAITNFIPVPGFTDFAIYIYDANGLMDYVCQKLNEKQVEYIDLATWGYVNNGFKGSAIVSATYWHHPLFDGKGVFLRHVVGLGAVTITRNGAVLAAEDMPGDEASGTLAFPIHNSFMFMGLEPPDCPGLDPAPGPADCPLEIEVASGNLELDILDGQTTEHTIKVQHGLADVFQMCEVTDVDVQLSVLHTDDSDLDVDLIHTVDPAGVPVSTTADLFSGICPGGSGIVAELDDDAATLIGSVCAPIGGKYKTAGNALSLFEGEYPGDDWTLRITDNGAGDQGKLLNWTIQLRTRTNY